jgi:hypothetical protein
MWVGSLPYLQILDYYEKFAIDKLILSIVGDKEKTFCNVDSSSVVSTNNNIDDKKFNVGISIVKQVPGMSHFAF